MGGTERKGEPGHCLGSCLGLQGPLIPTLVLPSPCPLGSALLGNDSGNWTPGFLATSPRRSLPLWLLLQHVTQPQPPLPHSSGPFQGALGPAHPSLGNCPLTHHGMLFREERGQSGRETCRLPDEKWQGAKGRRQVTVGAREPKGHRVKCLGTSPLTTSTIPVKGHQCYKQSLSASHAPDAGGQGEPDPTGCPG